MVFPFFFRVFSVFALFFIVFSILNTYILFRISRNRRNVRLHFAKHIPYNFLVIHTNGYNKPLIHLINILYINSIGVNSILKKSLKNLHKKSVKWLKTVQKSLLKSSLYKRTPNIRPQNSKKRTMPRLTENVI